MTNAMAAGQSFVAPLPSQGPWVCPGSTLRTLQWGPCSSHGCPRELWLSPPCALSGLFP